jgi:hypothetical protein
MSKRSKHFSSSEKLGKHRAMMGKHLLWNTSLNIESLTGALRPPPRLVTNCCTLFYRFVNYSRYIFRSCLHRSEVKDSINAPVSSIGACWDGSQTRRAIAWLTHRLNLLPPDFGASLQGRILPVSRPAIAVWVLTDLKLGTA